MIELGEIQTLNVTNTTDFGVYLGTEKEKVLLPSKQVPEGTKVGDEINVFIYRDSSDRLIATTRTPLLTLGQTTVLDVTEVTDIGAFLNWGLEKDLFLPFREQTHRVSKGESCVAALYIDKSSRLCATMKVYDYLLTDSPYHKDDVITGIIYELKDELGAFVAVDGRYHGLIPKSEIHSPIKSGEAIEARVAEVREDGKLVLSPRQKAYLQMDEDAELILSVIEKYNGVLPYTDKAAPERIEQDFHLSKNAFKRAVGRLLKEKKIEITSDSIKIL